MFVVSIISLLLFRCKTPNSIDEEISIVSSDINNFWEAYDKIITTNDSIKQRNYLKLAFIDKENLPLKPYLTISKQNYSYYSRITSFIKSNPKN